MEEALSAYFNISVMQPERKKKTKFRNNHITIFSPFFVFSFPGISYQTSANHVAEQHRAWKYYNAPFTVAKSRFRHISHCYKFSFESPWNTRKSSGITGYLSQHSPRYAIKPSSRKLGFSRFYLHGFRRAWFNLQTILP